VPVAVRHELRTPDAYRCVADQSTKASREAARMSAESYVSKWTQGGHTDLGRYRKNGSGIHLFRAYL
jgi:hypothetical protein